MDAVIEFMKAQSEGILDPVVALGAMSLANLLMINGLVWSHLAGQGKPGPEVVRGSRESQLADVLGALLSGQGESGKPDVSQLLSLLGKQGGQKLNPALLLALANMLGQKGAAQPETAKPDPKTGQLDPKTGQPEIASSSEGGDPAQSKGPGRPSGWDLLR